ncbi:MAG: TrkA family potassium uptake protein [Ruminococcaceae bacterium]|nr:TrkA family potassium uptake protein [Oscillospiraceae bacterium]
MKLGKKERVIIIGCGRLGSKLAAMLSEKNYQVVVIDKKESAFTKLPESFGGFYVKADGTDLDTLKYVDIEETAIFIACTESDNMNSLLAQIASRIFNVPNVYVRFEDVDKEKLIKGFNIQGIFPFNLTLDVFNEIIFGENKENEK